MRNGTIKLEKSYRGIINGNSLTLLREYMEELIKVIDPMGHNIRLVPYNNGEFVTGIADLSIMALKEQEERIYIESPERKPQFNHVTMKIRIVTSM